MSNISDVRQSLLDTLRDLRDTSKPLDVERAKAIAGVASVIVDSARVEVQYLQVTGQRGGEFFGHSAPPALTQASAKPGAPKTQWVKPEEQQ